MTAKQLRLEYNRPSFKRYIREALGCECHICNGTEDIEYHHLISLADGGTNDIRNILPLCSECHEKVHGARNIRKRYSSHKGRKRIAEQNPKCNEIFMAYAKGKIGTSECKELLGYKQGTPISGLSSYKSFLETYGIQKIKNNVDIKRKNGVLREDDAIGYIEYIDGRTEITYWN